MKCYEARLWLLSSRTAGPLSSAVARHLKGCDRCRVKWQALEQLDNRVRSMPIAPSSPTAKESFRRRLAEASGPTKVESVAADLSSTRPSESHTRRRVAARFVAGLVAASLLLGLGWKLGRGDGPPNVDVAAVGPASRGVAVNTGVEDPATSDLTDRPGELAILLRVMKHNNRLAASYDLEEQARIFDAMAEDLRTEILRRVERGSLEEGMALAEMYGVVIRDGLLPRVSRLPPEKKEALAKSLVAHFQKVSLEMDRFSRTSRPMAREALALTKATATEAANRMAGSSVGQSPTQAEIAHISPRPLLQTLVFKGLTLAAEPDPLNRADLCSDMAVRVAPSVMLLSAGASSDKAVAVGDCWGELLERGVAGNLEKLERERGKDAVREDVDKLRERTFKDLDSMEAGLADAPAALQANVKRTIEASAAGRERLSPGKGKGKGPSSKWGENDRPLPPGLQKKNQKQSNLEPLGRRDSSSTAIVDSRANWGFRTVSSNADHWNSREARRIRIETSSVHSFFGDWL